MGRRNLSGGHDRFHASPDPRPADATRPAGPVRHVTRERPTADPLGAFAGDLAYGFISVSGASTPELASDAVHEIVRCDTDMFGDCHDKSDTNVSALDDIRETLNANPEAIEDAGVSQAITDSCEAPNPCMMGDAKLRDVGETSFGQTRQVAVPLVVNVLKDSAFETKFVAEVG